MKRIFIFITVLIIIILPAFAEVYEKKYCAVSLKTSDTGNIISKVLSNATGANFVSTKAAELAIQKAIKTQLGSNTNVEIYPYTLTSLLQGKFKKMVLKSKSINFTGFHVSGFEAATVCDYNQVGVSDNNLLFKENFVMQFSGKITDADLKETMKSSQYLEMIDSVKITTLGQTLFKMSNMNISIKNDKLVIIAKVMSPLFWGMEQKTISAISGLSVEKGKIKYTDLNIMNMKQAKYLNGLLSLINLANPFTFEVKLSKNTTGYTSIKNVIIKNNTINVDGILYIPKNN